MRERIKSFLIDSKYQKLRFWSALILYFSILILGSIPGARTEVGQWASGLILHAMAYGAITWFLYTGLSGSRWKKSIAAFLTVATMGALDEFVQSFLSYRTGAVSDWLIDCSAALIVLLLIEAIQRYQSKAS